MGERSRRSIALGRGGFLNGVKRDRAARSEPCGAGLAQVESVERPRARPIVPKKWLPMSRIRLGNTF
jgi:hypothetical protein